MKRWIEQPCTQCDGDGWIEACIGLEHYTTGDFPRYRRETCDECDGTGEEPREENDNDDT